MMTKVWCLKAPMFPGQDDEARKGHNMVLGRRLTIPDTDTMKGWDSDALSEKKDEEVGSDSASGGASRSGKSSSHSSSSSSSSSSSDSSSSTTSNEPPLKRQQASESTLPDREKQNVAAEPAVEEAPIITELLEQMRAGRLPQTSAEQRNRQRLTHGTRYSVPATLKEALRHGFINPNLPPPPGMVWRRQTGGFRLCLQGG